MDASLLSYLLCLFLFLVAGIAIQLGPRFLRTGLFPISRDLSDATHASTPARKRQPISGVRVPNLVRDVSTRRRLTCYYIDETPRDLSWFERCGIWLARKMPFIH
ncbi:MAG: hypothetical protein U0840_18625 [Gemmataceae bacterium]